MLGISNRPRASRSSDFAIIRLITPGIVIHSVQLLLLMMMMMRRRMKTTTTTTTTTATTIINNEKQSVLIFIQLHTGLGLSILVFCNSRFKYLPITGDLHRRYLISLVLRLHSFDTTTLNIITYYPTDLRRVQITPKTSTNIMWYLYSRGPVRQVSCR